MIWHGGCYLVGMMLTRTAPEPGLPPPDDTKASDYSAPWRELERTEVPRPSKVRTARRRLEEIDLAELLDDLCFTRAPAPTLLLEQLRARGYFKEIA